MINFYNHFNNGDLHVSRNFVKLIQNFFGKACVYSHKQAKDILADINIMHNSDFIQSNDIWDHYLEKDTLWFNTWYAANHQKYISQYGISFDCLYSSFDEFMIEKFHISIKDICPNPQLLFPSIDFEKFAIGNIKSWLKSHKERKVLIVNAHARSGQSDNFVMMDKINEIAEMFPEITFIYTNIEEDQYSIKHMPARFDNLIYSSDIIKKEGCDLNEIAYLSTFCDLIIGRATGPFSFSFNQHNLFDRKTKLIVFANDQIKKKIWLSNLFEDKIEYNSDIIMSNCCDMNENKKMIVKEIEKL